MVNSKKLVLILFAILLLALVLGGCSTADKAAPPEKEKSESGQEPAPAPVDTWPTRPITGMSPFDAGGANDIMMLRFNKFLTKELGVQINMEYIAGGGGATGWANLVRQKPDGYYIGSINIPHIILQPMGRESGYKMEDLVPIAFVQETPNGIAVPKDSPFNTLDDLIQYAKKNPGKVTLAGTGELSGHHVATLEFMKKAEVEVTYVPFTGSAPQMAALLGKHVSGTFGNSNEFLTNMNDIKVLAIGSKERMSALPDVPTFAELGYEMYPSIRRGYAVPPGTPQEIIDRLEEILLKAANDPDVIASMAKDGEAIPGWGHEESKKQLKELYGLYEELLSSVK